MSVPAAAGILINADSATGAAQLPVGTTGQRPASPVTGQLRFNSTTSLAEVYNGTAWVGIQTPYLAQFLVVAGGGGSGGFGGAGGAGGVIQGSLTLVSGTNYAVLLVRVAQVLQTVTPLQAMGQIRLLLQLLQQAVVTAVRIIQTVR
jgi:hypothetical protein